MEVYDIATSERVATSYREWVKETGISTTAYIITEADSAPTATNPSVGDTVQLIFKRSQREILLNKSRSSYMTATVTLPLDHASEPCVTYGASLPLDSPASFSPDPSGRLVAIFRKDTPNGAGADAKPRAAIEIWSLSGGGLMSVIYVDPTLHGDLITDSWFGSDLVWSPDSSCIAYVAESKAAELSCSLFDPCAKVKAKGTSTDSGSKPPLPVARAFDWDIHGGGGGPGKESWGEKYESVRLPKVYIASLASQTVVELPSPADVSCGQPAWGLADSPAGLRYLMAYTQWNGDGRRLGMIYCYNRSCSVHVTDITGVVAGLCTPPSLSTAASESKEVLPHSTVCVSSGHAVARSGHFLQAGGTTGAAPTLVFLSMDGTAIHTHNGASSMHTAQLEVSHVDGDASVLTIRSVTQVVGVSDVPTFHVPTLPVRQSQDDTDTVRETTEPPLTTLFPSLYTHLLPADCSVGNYVVVQSLVGSRHVLARVDCRPEVESGEAARVALLQSVKHVSVKAKGPSTSAESNVLIAVGTASSGKAVMCVSVSSPSCPPTLHLIYEDTCGGYRSCHLSGLDSSLCRAKAEVGSTTTALPGRPAPKFLLPTVNASVLEAARQFEWEHVPTPTPGMDAYLLFNNKETTGTPHKVPLVVVPHGGPHSTFTVEYLSTYAFLAAQGFAILFVNYRGSLGFGEKYTAALAGNIGRMDVDDMVTATQAALHAHAHRLDGSRVGILGGSHGGFLAAHCVGQFPDIFKAAVLRNPVTNIASMVTTSDIPDWCFTEALGCGSYSSRDSSLPVASDLKAMYECSPIAHASRITAPVLFTLGLKDRRVPASQGMELYYYLKARGVPTRMLAYPEDVHAIDKPASEADAWVNIALWMARHLHVEL